MSALNDLDARLEAFTARLVPQVDVQAVAARAKLEPDYVTRLLAIYANEAKVGLRLVAPHLRPGLRLLEVGSGIGMLLHFLSQEGVEIVGIEPGASGFGFMPAMQAEIARLCQTSARCLPIGAEALQAEAHGSYDLIISTNVLEHIPDLAGAFAGMSRVLASGGKMIHACPNYRIPYEPHYAIPLIPFLPRQTARLFPRVKVLHPGLWDELNFITASDVKRLCAANGLEVRFERGLLAASLKRLAVDAEFRARQGAFGQVVGRIIALLHLHPLIERLPGEWATPMVFTAQKRL